ncbi:MAG: hypothetical protein IKF36_01760 [Bacilli bacterium]|nr:hypothetical protein [Bacilli bacterium]
MKTEEPKIKRTSKGAIAAIIIGTVLFFIGVIVGIIFLVIYLIPKDYKGTWVCDNNIQFEIDDNFEMYVNNSLASLDDYSVKNMEIKNERRNYLLEVGNKEYDISIKNKEMYMIETNSYTIYKCTKRGN